MQLTIPTQQTFNSQLRDVQRAGQDFEWYPTTQEIIQRMVNNLKSEASSWDHRRSCMSNESAVGFLDIGAGNGKVLAAVKGIEGLGKLYAIEKSQTLQETLPRDVFILGCDFHHTSLIDKTVKFIFCNPPYSEFQEWARKIIEEAPAEAIVYLVIPQRWSKSPIIEDAIAQRKATTSVLGSYDFEDAEDRKARAKVDLLKVSMPKARWQDKGESDPFVKFFNDTFQFAPDDEKEDHLDEQIEQAQIVHRMNLIEALCHLHDSRMAELQRNYQAICSISPAILKEFEISKSGLCESLKMKLSTAKKEYWRRLFDGVSEINSRLTKKSREDMLRLMHSNTGVEFNRDNAYAMVFWVIKNANSYFDQQLIDTYQNLVEFANVENYASNKRVFERDRFRYQWHEDKEVSHLRLKVGHRIVLSRCGGLSKGWTAHSTGLCPRATEHIGDLLAVANNLGFNVVDEAPKDYEWKDNEARVFTFKDSKGVSQVLFRVRAFWNSNLHFQFCPDFIHALNTQHGKLKGWLRNDAQASEELNIPREVAAKHFQPGFQLTGLNSIPKLANA